LNKNLLSVDTSEGITLLQDSTLLCCTSNNKILDAAANQHNSNLLQMFCVMFAKTDKKLMSNPRFKIPELEMNESCWVTVLCGWPLEVFVLDEEFSHRKSSRTASISSLRISPVSSQSRTQS
jgi:hypothetical protein